MGRRRVLCFPFLREERGGGGGGDCIRKRLLPPKPFHRPSLSLSFLGGKDGSSQQRERAIHQYLQIHLRRLLLLCWCGGLPPVIKASDLMRRRRKPPSSFPSGKGTLLFLATFPPPKARYTDSDRIHKTQQPYCCRSGNRQLVCELFSI